jgi:RND family efflux transporter MFP subunit
LEIKTTQAGSVHAFEHAELFAKVSGYLKVQNVDIGDTVKLGQLLAEIDDPEIHKAVDQARAALDQSKARVKVADAKIRTAEAEREAAEAMTRQAEAEVKTQEYNHEYRTKAYSRVYGLVQRNATDVKLLDESKDQLDSASAAVSVANAAVLSAKATVTAKQANIEQAKADLAEAKSKVEMAQADLEKAEVLASYTRITSPYDGVITLRTYHRGDFVHSAADGPTKPLLSVDRVDLMRVVFPVPDREVRYVNKGDEVWIKINALPGREFQAKVSRFAMSEDPHSRNMRTEADLPNKDGILHQGMYGDVTVILQQASPKSVTIPSSAIIGQNGIGDGFVYVVREGKAHKQGVRVGADNGSEAEIDEGLTTGDEVIYRYNGAIGEGSPVRAEATQTEKSGH